MGLKEVVEAFGKSAVEAVKEALKVALKPLLLQFAKDLIQLLKDEAAKTATPIDDIVVSAAEPKVIELVEDALAKI